MTFDIKKKASRKKGAFTCCIRAIKLKALGR